MKAVVSVAIVVAPPIPIMCIVVGPVVCRRIRVRFDERDPGKIHSDTNVRMCLGRNALGHTCDPEGGS
jgi:hypothetical protein